MALDGVIKDEDAAPVGFAGTSTSTKRIPASLPRANSSSASQRARLPTDTPWPFAYDARLSPLPTYPDTNRILSFSL